MLFVETPARPSSDNRQADVTQSGDNRRCVVVHGDRFAILHAAKPEAQHSDQIIMKRLAVPRLQSRERPSRGLPAAIMRLESGTTRAPGRWTH